MSEDRARARAERRRKLEEELAQQEAELQARREARERRRAERRAQAAAEEAELERQLEERRAARREAREGREGSSGDGDGASEGMAEDSLSIPSDDDDDADGDTNGDDGNTDVTSGDVTDTHEDEEEEEEVGEGVDGTGQGDDDDDDGDDDGEDDDGNDDGKGEAKEPEEADDEDEEEDDNGMDPDYAAQVRVAFIGMMRKAFRCGVIDENTAYDDAEDRFQVDERWHAVHEEERSELYADLLDDFAANGVQDSSSEGEDEEPQASGAGDGDDDELRSKLARRAQLNQEDDQAGRLLAADANVDDATASADTPSRIDRSAVAHLPEEDQLKVLLARRAALNQEEDQAQRLLASDDTGSGKHAGAHGDNDDDEPLVGPNGEPLTEEEELRVKLARRARLNKEDDQAAALLERQGKDDADTDAEADAERRRGRPKTTLAERLRERRQRQGESLDEEEQAAIEATDRLFLGDDFDAVTRIRAMLEEQIEAEMRAVEEAKERERERELARQERDKARRQQAEERRLAEDRRANSEDLYVDEFEAWRAARRKELGMPLPSEEHSGATADDAAASPVPGDGEGPRSAQPGGLPNPLIVCLAGPEGSGSKTSLIHRLVQDDFTGEADAALEGVFHTQVDVDGDTVQLELQDTTGLSEFRFLREEWYGRSHAFILGYSVDSKADMKLLRDEVVQDVEAAKDARSRELPLVLVAAKADLEEAERNVKEKEGRAAALELQCPFFEVSAKTGSNVVESFREVVRAYKRKVLQQDC